MTHDLPDYYTVLGVASTASSAEIAHAYRCRVRDQHPDARPDSGQDADSEGLGEVIAAYAVLRDPTRRADYDRQRQPTTNTSSASTSPPSTSPPGTPFAPPSRTPLLRVGPVRYHGPPH